MAAGGRVCPGGLAACVWSGLAGDRGAHLVGEVTGQAAAARAAAVEWAIGSVRRRGSRSSPTIASLTPFGGSAVVGELVRRLELIPALDRAIETAPKVGGLGPVKQRARGCSPGQLLVAVAESMLCGGDSMLDLERLRADRGGRRAARGRRGAGRVDGVSAGAALPALASACRRGRRSRPARTAWTPSSAARRRGR